ncbi:MAG: O-antigen ligase family protein [Clostridia bacterium]|nr:O-antigen ligase family protein [Clostridia bacterium]
MKKRKNRSADTGDIANIVSVSLIFFLFDKFSDFIYNAIKNSFFGKIFTSYTKEQEAFDNSYLRAHFANSGLIKKYFRNFRKFLSKEFESSYILNMITKASKGLVTMPLRTLGNFFFSFGIYVVIIYLLRLFLPVISEADISYAIIGIIVCVSAIPMLLSHDNIASAVGKSAVLGALFSNVFGYREEVFKQRTNLSKAKSNVMIFFGMALGILTVAVHPLVILSVIVLTVMVALIFVSPEIGIVISLFVIPFLSFFEYSALMLGLLVLIICVSFLVKLIRGKRILKFEIIDLAVVFFAVIIYFSGAISAGGFEGYKEVLLSCELILGYFLIVNLMRTEQWIRRCISALVTSGTIVAFIGIGQYFFNSLSSEAWLDTEYFYDIKGRAVSLFDNPNILAIYLVIVLPFALYMMISAQKGRAKLLGAISVASVLLCIVLTWSRGAWLAAIFCLVLFLLIYSRKTLRYMLLSCMFVPFLPFFLPQSVVRRFTSIGDLADSSTMYRVYTWRGTLNMIKEYFMGGIGYGSTAFQNIYPQYAYAGIEAAEHSHSLFLQILVGTGIIGLIAFALIIFLFTQMNFEYIKNSKDMSGKLIVTAAFCAILASLLFGMFDLTWYSYRIFFLFWAVMAIASACVRVGRDEERRHSTDEMADFFDIPIVTNQE